jgi:outer membrane protein assembly factor BamB
MFHFHFDLVSRNVRQALMLAAVALTAGAGQADDWPQWHGPNRDGISKETGWLATWPAEGPKRLWQAEVGTGYGTVSVSKGRLYVLGNTDNTDTVYCLDANTGASVWKHSYPCLAKDERAGFHGPRSTPTVDGDRVYTLSRHGHLFCLDAASGSVKWSKELVNDLGGSEPVDGDNTGWGYALSPLVEGDVLIVEAGGKGASAQEPASAAPGASVVALEKETGKVLWKAGNDRPGYSSPVAFDLKGRRCLAVFTAGGPVVRQLKDGGEVWRFSWKTSYEVNAATPIVSEGKLFISSGYNRGCALFDLSSNPPAPVWQSKVIRNHANSCVLWQGHVYGFDESQLKCIEWATGEMKWGEGKYRKGSVMLADGKLILYSEDGKLGIAEATPAGYKELAFTQAIKVRDSYPGKAQKPTWAVPVLANGRVYCRSQDDLVCLDVKAK